AAVLEGWTARIAARAVGLLLLRRHSTISAEIYWLGVDPEHHRHGIGRTLIEAVAQRLKQEGIRFLFVMTLHPGDPYEPYRRTRAFYQAIGFEMALSAADGPGVPPADRLAWFLKLL